MIHQGPICDQRPARYHARWVLPIATAPIERGTVVVEGGRIAWVGPRAEAPPAPDCEDVNLGDAILLPGLVNTHTHLELSAMRGFLEELSFRDWIVTLQRAKTAVLTPQRMLDAARLGVREGLRAGITTYADTCDSGVALAALREAGVRGIMYQEVFGPAPAQCDGSLADLRAKVDRHRAAETDLVRVGVSPHAPYTVSDELFAAVARYARDERLPLATHVAESELESRYVVHADGQFADGLRARGIPVSPRAPSPIALLERLGVLGDATLLVHCVRADADDVRRIAGSRSAVAHCPISNAKLGHGVAPLAELLAAGVPVGLGSDSVASNNRMDLLEEARAAVLHQRARLADPAAVPAAAALELATLGGARALRLADRVGSLDVGKEADLAAFSLDDLASTPTHDPIAAAIFSLGGRPARLVTVAGRVLVRDGVVLAADDGLAARVRETAEAMHSWRAAQASGQRVQPLPVANR